MSRSCSVRPTSILLGAFLLLLSYGTTALAQSESGRAALTGSVSDATGARIPNATLTLTETQTGQNRTLKSDSVGLYSFPSLTVGEYTIVAQAPKFGEATIQNILLTVGQTAEINITLRPSSVSNTITVTTDTDLTNRTAVDNSTLLNNEVVENLPTRGRNFTDFALLTPGISQEGDRFGLVVNGQRSGNSNISIDGVDFNDPLQNGQRGGSVSVYFYPQVAVREFQVVRTGLSPEVGRTNAGFINVVTKSGTNRYHGEALYTNRNPWLTWPDALNDPETNNNQSQLGFGIGGPILRDKLFFFAGIEKTWLQVPYFVRIGSNCPTAGYYDQNAGSVTLVTTPAGHEYYNYQGPAEFAVDAGCSLGAPGIGTSPLPAKYAAMETDSFGRNNPLASSARLDWQVNDKNTAMVQYLSTFLSGVAYGISGISNATPSNNTNYAQQSQAVILGLTTVLASNRTNDMHLQWAYDNRQQNPNTPGAAEIDIGDFLNIGGTAAGSYIYRAIREEFNDNFSWLLGKHAFRFGIDINIAPETQQREPNPNGLWTVDSLSDYILALPTSQGGGGMTPRAINTAAGACGSQTSSCPYQFQQTLPYNGGPLPRYRGTQREFAGYFLDAYHVLPRLTLNLGFRYDAQLEPQGQVNPLVAGTGIDPSDVTMWQPRVGLVWDVRGNGNTVVRASTGLFDARTPGYLIQHSFTDNGQFVANVNSNYDQNILNQVPTFGSFPSLSSVSTTTGILNDIYANNPNFRNPRSMQVALTVEQKLTRRTALVVAFTNQESWKLQHRLDTNLFAPSVDPATLYPIFPSTNPLTGISCAVNSVSVPCRPNSSIAGFHQDFSTAHSTYRSLIAQFKGEITSKLTTIANFTWASNRDDDSNERDADRELSLDSLCTSCYNRGYGKQDIRDQFNFNAIYHLPLRFIFSTSFIARTGLPYTAITSGSKQGDLGDDGNTKNDRPILCSLVAYTVCTVSSTQINQYKGGAEVGTVVGRDTFRQPGFLNWDMRLIKSFRIHHAQEIQFSAECLNCSRASNLNLGANATSKFSHAQATLNPFTGYYYSGNTAGRMTNAYDTFRSGGPRQIQLGTRFVF